MGITFYLESCTVEEGIREVAHGVSDGEAARRRLRSTCETCVTLPLKSSNKGWTRGFEGSRFQLNKQAAI